MYDGQSRTSQLVLAQVHGQMLNHAWFSTTGIPDAEASLCFDGTYESCSTVPRAAAGGLMILNNNFAVSSLQLAGNSAFYGGAIFLSADLSANATTSNLTFSGNSAEEGQAQCRVQHIHCKCGLSHCHDPKTAVAQLSQTG